MVKMICNKYEKFYSIIFKKHFKIKVMIIKLKLKK